MPLWPAEYTAQNSDLFSLLRGKEIDDSVVKSTGPSYLETLCFAPRTHTEAHMGFDDLF